MEKKIIKLFALYLVLFISQWSCSMKASKRCDAHYAFLLFCFLYGKKTQKYVSDDKAQWIQRKKKNQHVTQLLIISCSNWCKSIDLFFKVPLKTSDCCCCGCLFVTNFVVEEVKFQCGLYFSWTKRQNENQCSELLWIYLYCLWEKWQTGLETFKKLRNIKNLHWFRILKARDRFKLRRLTMGYLLV